MKRNIGAELAARVTHLNEMLANGESVGAISRADVDSPQPVAWAVLGDGYEYVSLTPEMCVAWAAENGGRTVPLYAKPEPTSTPSECSVRVERTCPRCGGDGIQLTVTMDATLTDAEREAIQTAAMLYEQGAKQMGHVEDGKRAVALRAMLERLG